MKRILYKNGQHNSQWAHHSQCRTIRRTIASNGRFVDFWFEVPVDDTSFDNIWKHLCRCFWCAFPFWTREINVIQSKLFTVKKRRQMKLDFSLKNIDLSLVEWKYSRKASSPFVAVHQTPSNVAFNLATILLKYRIAQC